MIGGKWISVLSCAALTAVSCAKKPSIVGDWQDTTSKTQVQFFQDGRCVGEASGEDTVLGKFSFAGPDRIHLESGGILKQSAPLDFSVALGENDLRLTDESGKVWPLKRLNRNQEAPNPTSMEQANRKNSLKHLGAIDAAARMYANIDPTHAFAKDLETLYRTQDFDPRSAVSPRTHHAAPRLRGAELGKWAAAHSDYVWAGDGKHSTSTTADDIIAWENPDGLTDGICVLFGDGHSGFVEMNKAMAMIAKAKAPQAK